MSDLVVSQHIDDLLRSSSASGSRNVLNVPSVSEVPTIQSFNALSESVARIDGSLINVLSLSGDTYTLQLSNLGAYIRKFHSSPHTIIIPNSSDVSFQVGSTFVIRNTSSSSLTISSGSTVSLSYFADLSANILDQYASAQIVCVGTDNWDII